MQLCFSVVLCIILQCVVSRLAGAYLHNVLDVVNEDLAAARGRVADVTDRDISGAELGQLPFAEHFMHQTRTLEVPHHAVVTDRDPAALLAVIEDKLLYNLPIHIDNYQSI